MKFYENMSYSSKCACSRSTRVEQTDKGGYLSVDAEFEIGCDLVRRDLYSELEVGIVVWHSGISVFVWPEIISFSHGFDVSGMLFSNNA